MVKQLFIVNADAFAAEYADVQAGKLGFINASQEGAPTISGEIAGTSPIQVALKKLTSVEVKPGEVVRTTLAPYSAGVKQVVTVNLTGVTEDEPFIKLMDVTIGTMAMPMKSFAADTAAEVASLINAEGARPDSDWYGYIAVNNVGTITVTAPLDKAFRVAANKGAVITYTTPPTYTNGTPEKVAEKEQECLTWDGFTNKVLFPVIKPDSEVDKATTYDLVYCDVIMEKSVKDGSRTPGLEKIQLVFAVDRTNTTVTTTAIKAQLDKLTTTGSILSQVPEPVAG